MNNTELIFVPAPGIGHLLSCIEFAKRLLHRHDTFFITVLVIKLPSASTVPFEPVSDASRIRYLHLPQLYPPEFTDSPEAFFTDYIDSYKNLVKDAITDHLSSKSSPEPLAGLVLDLFCTGMVDVAKDLGVPSYIYFTSGAEFLGYMLYLPIRHELVGAEFAESEPESAIPSYVNPVPASVLPDLSFNKKSYYSFLNHARNFKETKGIIVNTFAELESHAVSSFTSDNYGHVPPVYTVGPLLNLNDRKPGRARDEIIKWLDDQPTSSVVFLCFGSRGRFDEAQVREIANGLGRSGARYLWSLRKAPSNRLEFPEEYNDGELEEVLPREFRESAAGMVCGWAPQTEVLAHRAIGGFVSHCGWNSILESLWFGVPIATWPLYAEQQVNAFEMVRDLGLAVELRLDYRMDGGDVVVAGEVERAVRCVMEGESEVRKRVKEMSEKSRRAVVEGGSSYESLGRLIQDMLKHVSVDPL